MSDDHIIRDAQFNPRVRSYWLLGGTLGLAATIVGIVLVPVWIIAGRWITGRYLDRMSCTLTERTLKVRKGLLVRVEKTVPLDKITDLGLVQGPIMRYFDVEAISIETAGQSGTGPLVRLAGIVDARGFRDAVLRQRDLIAAEATDERTRTMPVMTGTPTVGAGAEALLADIRDTLRRIESRLAKDDS